MTAQVYVCTGLCMKVTFILFPIKKYVPTIAGETGADREGPSPPPRAPSIPFPGWDPGGPIYNENGPFLLLLDCFSAIAIVV